MATRLAIAVVLVAACSSRQEAPQPAQRPARDPHDLALPPPPAPEAPPATALAGPPSTAQRTASGLASEILKASTSPEIPRVSDAVVMTMDAWDASGKLVESYTTADAFELTEGMPGMIEGILQMRRGEKRRLWISEPLQGSYRLAPGTIVCDLELVAVVRR